MKVWICSDTHFFHKNIIKYCNRPFTSIPVMNDYIIRAWNANVEDDDIVFFLGDFCFAKTSEAKETTEWLTRALKGHKFIVKGNHDFSKFRYTDVGWEQEWYQEFDFGRFNFRHRPDDIVQAAKDYDFVFYGHVHDKIIGNAPINTINVCVDVTHFQPLDITNYFTELELKELQKLIKINTDKE